MTNSSSSARGSGKVLQADLAMVGATAIWGATFVVVKGALQFASPLAFNAVRMGVAAVVLALIFRRYLFAIDRRVLQAGVLLGVLMGAGFAFQTTGLAYTSPSKSAFLTGLSVILVPFFVAAFLRRRVGWNSFAGAGLALVGLYLLAFAGAADAVQGRWWAAPNRGDVLTIACAFAFALHVVALGEYSTRFGFQQLAILQVAFCGLFSALVAPWVEPIHLQPTTVLIVALLISSLLSTVVAFTTQAWAQQFTPATHVAVVLALEPVFGWLSSLIFLHQGLRGRELVGSGLILAAILITELGGRTTEAERIEVPA